MIVNSRLDLQNGVRLKLRGSDGLTRKQRDLLVYLVIADGPKTKSEIALDLEEPEGTVWSNVHILIDRGFVKTVMEGKRHITGRKKVFFMATANTKLLKELDLDADSRKRE